MQDLPPAVRDAYGLLRRDLLGYLDDAENLALKLGSWSEAEKKSVRKLIPDLTTVIRGMLAVHQAASNGDCTGCLGRPTPWPCDNVQTIHALLKDPDREFIKLMETLDYT
jgi:hypothetical protein